MTNVAPLHKPMPWWTTCQQTLKFRDGGRERPYVDCFGFVRLAYHEQLGLTLPAWPDLTLEDLTAHDRSLLEHGFTTGFHPVQTGFEQAFDVAVIRRPMQVNNRAKLGWWHVGLVSEPGFIVHMDQAMGLVNMPFRDTSLARSSATLKPRDVMLFRHESLSSAQAQDERVCA